MTDEEVEVVAEELANVGGLSWYPGRTKGELLRAVSDRYRDQARAAIAALERLRQGAQDSSAPQPHASEAGQANTAQALPAPATFQIGSIVVYRPPRDRRAMPCRIEKLEEGRAHLVPCAKPDIGWVVLDTLQSMPPEEHPQRHKSLV
ncbi:hypothetical protein MicloDRAFT_00032910 [Microvirga lotononidis]|uniref:Uncharacterized protein n=1 Tax=Microvirga lotononidis TaxID=864069 RepID=I4YRZ9_9HYPH|nr:hypothetical protein MicloDRAFT_00032910 [Microvirga lotononidis]